MIMQPPAEYTRSERRFPRKTFKGLAGLTIAVGLVCVIVSVVEIAYSVHQVNDDGCYPEMYYRDAYDFEEDREWRKKRSPFESWSWEMDSNTMEQVCFVYNIASASGAGVILCCAVIFVVTGSLGVAAARSTVGHRQSGLKTGYIVLNILNVLFFAPTVFLIGQVLARFAPPILFENDGQIYAHVTMHQMLSVLGGGLFVLCLVAASVSCCCAPTVEHMKMVTVAAAPIPPYMEEIPELMIEKVENPPVLEADHVKLVENEATEA